MMTTHNTDCALTVNARHGCTCMEDMMDTERLEQLKIFHEHNHREPHNCYGCELITALEVAEAGLKTTRSTFEEAAELDQAEIPRLKSALEAARYNYRTMEDAAALGDERIRKLEADNIRLGVEAANEHEMVERLKDDYKMTSDVVQDQFKQSAGSDKPGVFF